MPHRRLTWEESDSLPEELESAEAKLVYLYIYLADEITIDELQEDLNISHMSLLTILDLLEEKGYVACDEAKYRCVS